MFRGQISRKAGCSFSLLALALAAAAAHAQSIRVVTYNIEDDIDGATTPLPGMNTVLEGIGEDKVDGIAQPLDILALEETTSNSQSVAPIVADLNGDYPGADYLQSTYQATQDGSNADGNGPNAIVYNASALTLLASVGVGTPEGAANGEYRQVVRYEFQPVNGTAAQDFYVYVCHAKSGTPSVDATDRAEEAAIIRKDSATLPADSSIIYTGDWNTDASTDQSVVNMTAAGPNPAVDELNPTNQAEDWDTSSTYQSIMTESATDLRYRDDIQFVTPNVYGGSGAVTYISGSENALGNDGETPVFGTVNTNANTACAGFTGPTQSAVLAALTTASDHLPVVADYDINANPNPGVWSASGGGSWSTGTDWAASIIPQLQGQSATFAGAITAPSTVTLNATWTVASVTFNSANSYTLAPGNGGELILDNGINNAAINDVAGTHAISAPISLNSTTDITISNAGDSLDLAGGINGGFGVAVSGNGTLVLSGSPNSVTAISISGSASVDLTNQSLAINYGGSPDPVGTIQGYLASGALTSSNAAASSGRFALGYADGNVDSGGVAQPGQLLIEYALVGDANLDGTVNLTDLLALLNSYGQTGVDWADGDFNYDGAVNLTDLLALLNNYGQSADTAAFSSARVVPEPAVGGLLIFGALGLARRVRKPGACDRA